jgi:hypothetical protein
MPDVVDEKLAQGLKQARKKPRNFVLLAKGTSVLKLIVDKKPIKTGVVQEARAETKANLILKGVVEGDGAELVFKLVGDEPTIKIPAFRDYISEQTSLKLKPRFQVVPELAEINDDEDEAGEGETETSVGQTPPEAPPEVPTTADPLAALVATMKSLAPHVQSAIQKDPGQKDALLAQVGEFQTHVKAKDATAAKAVLTRLGELLKGAKATGGQPGQGSVPSGEFKSLWPKAKSAWLDALDTVNGQLEKLRRELIGIDDAELKRIAEFGLNAITADHKVPLQAAIIDVDEATAGGTTGEAAVKAVAKAKDLVVEFRDHIDTDERVEACDDNPFDVKVTIRESLDAALAQMEQALAAA